MSAVPLGGGTLLSHGTSDTVEVVDLQLLGLDSITKNGNSLELGATRTLQSLLESEHCPAVLKSALKLEAPLNIRNSATVAGTLVACDGRSTFASVLLALYANLDVRYSKVDSRKLNIGDFLPLRPRGLITSITIPLNVKLAFDCVSKTPSDKPLVCVALTGALDFDERRGVSPLEVCAHHLSGICHGLSSCVVEHLAGTSQVQLQDLAASHSRFDYQSVAVAGWLQPMSAAHTRGTAAGRHPVSTSVGSNTLGIR